MANMQDYEKMSREELMQIIGTEVDASTPRETLITMAMQHQTEDGT